MSGRRKLIDSEGGLVHVQSHMSSPQSRTALCEEGMYGDAIAAIYDHERLSYVHPRAPTTCLRCLARAMRPFAGRGDQHRS